jgi:hypothetical protein
MVRKIVQLSESQSEALERRARERGSSFSEMIRQSVDLLLQQEPVMDEIRRRAIAAVGFASSGDADVSVRHDDYLAEAYRE